VRKLPDFLSFFDGAMMGCCAGTSFESLRKLGVGSHSKLAVYGLGPVGLTAVIEAKTLGAYVIGVDIQEKRLGFGTKYGCDEVVDASKQDPAKVIMKLTNGKGVDAAFEASGNALLNAIKSVSATGGRVCAVGWGKDRFEVPQFNSGYSMRDTSSATASFPSSQYRS
jgi:threonine dehydrogenase-like Zn-dependent dehydrogenase